MDAHIKERFIRELVEKIAGVKLAKLLDFTEVVLYEGRTKLGTTCPRALLLNLIDDDTTIDVFNEKSGGAVPVWLNGVTKIEFREF